MRLDLLLGLVGEAREAAFAGQRGHDVEEPLASLERRVTFDLFEGLCSLRASITPSAGDLRQIACRVLNVDHDQPGVDEQPFGLTRRDKKEIADRGPERDLLAVENASDYDRVRKEKPPSGPE